MNSNCEKTKYNCGLFLIKIFLSFIVVISHCWTDLEYSKMLIPFGMMRTQAASAYMIISFYLISKKIPKGNSGYIKKRIKQLVAPHVFWTIIYWLIFSTVDFVCSAKLVNGVSDLFWQMLTGHCARMNPAMWFLLVQTLVSVLFFTCFYCLKFSAGMGVISLLAVLAVFLQYSGINYSLFSPLRFELRYPLGRIAEMIPCAYIGFILGYFDICSKIKKYWMVLLPVFVFAGIKTAISTSFIEVQGFGSSGFQILIVSLMLVMTTAILPLDWISEGTKALLKKLSSLSFGVYCMHNLVCKLFYLILDSYGIKTGSFGLCIVIFFICLGVSALIHCIPGKRYNQFINNWGI